MKAFAATCVLTALVAPATTVRGTEPADGELSLFHKGLWSLQLNGSYAYDFEDEDARPASGSVSASYYFFDNVAIGAEANLYRVDQPGDDACAYGFGVVVKHHFLFWDRGTGAEKSLFLDAGFSTFEADTEVPPGGTEFNFVTRVGLGVTWQLTDRVHLITGARYFHLSNASREGHSRNPSIDGAVEGFVGILLTF